METRWTAIWRPSTGFESDKGVFEPSLVAGFGKPVSLTVRFGVGREPTNWTVYFGCNGGTRARDGPFVVRLIRFGSCFRSLFGLPGVFGFGVGVPVVTSAEQAFAEQAGMGGDAVPARFLEEFLREQRRIYLFIGSLLPDPGDIEDVYQQTCLALWKKRDRIGEVRDFFSWACGFARKEVLHQLRSNARKGAVHLSEEMLMQLAEEFEADPEDDVRLAALTGCLAKLQDRQRGLLKRCYVGEEPIKAIAASMSISAAALTMRLQRIRHAVVKCIQKTLAEGAGA